jgi:hypothetical protein
MEKRFVKWMNGQNQAALLKADPLVYLNKLCPGVFKMEKAPVNESPYEACRWSVRKGMECSIAGAGKGAGADIEKVVNMMCDNRKGATYKNGGGKGGSESGGDKKGGKKGGKKGKKGGKGGKKGKKGKKGGKGGKKGKKGGKGGKKGKKGEE